MDAEFDSLPNSAHIKRIYERFLNLGTAARSSSLISSSIEQLMPNASTVSSTRQKQTGNLASFICHVAYLEKALKDDTTNIFLNEKVEADTLKNKLGEGSQFSVFRAETKYKKNWKAVQAQKWGDFVALKTVKRKDESDIARNDWSSVLLEVRALLHPYLRYHPNIVRLIGFSWSSGAGSTSVYPVLVMEYAKHGSLGALQESIPHLRVQVKQKLCYDIARGLSILHACGIVHGDLKHENVLVFDNPYDEPKNQPYLAKLADFGGAAMDTTLRASHSLILGTFPYDAPEAASVLSANGLKKTDVYSFGLLIWRTLIDGKDLMEELNVPKDNIGQGKVLVKLLKDQDMMLATALHSITTYTKEHAIDEQATAMIVYAICYTIRTDPAERSLAHAQAAFRGMKLDDIENFVQNAFVKGEDLRKQTQGDGIRRMTIDVDSIGFSLGKMGDFYDAQENMPGYRTELSHPETGEFLFEPLKLKQLLTWSQQEQIVEELKIAAKSPYGSSAVELQPFRAAYYVFQAYLAGFGVKFDAQETCNWLHEASKHDDDGTVDYFAQAWLWRICNALDCPQPNTTDILFQNIKFGIFRGYRPCLLDAKMISEQLTSSDQKTKLAKDVEFGKSIFLTVAGGVGMPYFAKRKLRKNWDLDNLDVLDNQIMEELGDKYEDCLRATPSPTDDPVKVLKDSLFNKIFVNHVGHGLVHYAATFGKLEALQHIIRTYKCDINVGNELSHETPLISAVRSVQYQCAVLLLNSGATPGRHDLGEDTALHWICAFELDQYEMESLAQKIIDSGADLEEPCSTNVRHINADWEEMLKIPVTPLGRAVIMRSAPAVRILLKLGANPRAQLVSNKNATKSPLELAAVLMYPEILEQILRYLDETPGTDKHVFNESWLLRAAHDKTITSVDPTNLQSRLVRLGSEYKSAMFQTLRILYDRHQRTRTWQNVDPSSTSPGKLLCTEIRLGNRDIVEALLELGHDANGSLEFRPLEAAVSTNNIEIFQLLLSFGADITKRYTIENGRKYSFLQLFACRPQMSPPSLWIAEHLIASKLPIEPIKDGSPSAFALAVENQYFDLADLLLAEGADLNIIYQNSTNTGQPQSILAHFITENTERSLDSIKYFSTLRSREKDMISKTATNAHAIATDPFALLQAHMTALSVHSVAKLTPIAIPSVQMNIFHQLAWQSTDFVNANFQVSRSIITTILDAFPEEEHINRVHPILGTPSCIAAISSNIEMITALLGKGASPRESVPKIDTFFSASSTTFGVTHKPEHGTPIWIALAVYESLLDNYLASHKEKLDTSERIIYKLLAVSENEEADAKWKILRDRRIELLEAEKLKVDAERKNEAVVDGESAVVDLSVMTEEKPSGWREGVESTDEISTRTFLRFFRGGS